MSKKQAFFEWWTKNGCYGRDIAIMLFRQQSRPVEGINVTDIRRFIKEFKEFKGGVDAIPKIILPVELPDINDTEKLLSFLKNRMLMVDLQDIYNISAIDIGRKIRDLTLEGHNISNIGGIYKLEKYIIPQDNTIINKWDGERIIRFGVVADTHLCSKYQQISFLYSLYDLYEREGIDTVYHGGDISEGYNKRRAEHVHELVPGCIGVDDQAEYIIKYYPAREGIITKFITGNHDHWHINNGGADIGKMIFRERPDMINLGCANAVIELTPNCRMELNHPLDGSAYALSYSLQKYMDSMSGGDKPNILINGHHHKAMYLFYRNVHAIEAGTIQAQSMWMKGKRLSAHTGGWIITVHVNNDGEVKRFIPEFIPLYKIIKEDY